MKSKKYSRILIYFLIVCWAIIILFTILIFPLSKTENIKFDTTYKYYELGNWKVNGQKATMPYYVKDDTTDVFMQTTTLPGDTRENCSLMFSTNYCKYRVYVNNKLIFSYGYTDQLPFGSMTGNYFLTVPLDRSYSNKKLSIVTERVFHLEKILPFNKFYLPKVYYGDTASFKLDILNNNIWQLVFISFLGAMGLFGLCFVGYQLILGSYQKNVREFFFLSALSFFIAGWILGNSSLLQFITNSSEATAFLTYISLASGCGPYLGYCSELLPSKRKLFKILNRVAYILPIFTIVSFVTNLCDPVHLLTLSQLQLILSLIVSITIGIKEWKSESNSKMFVLAIVIAFIVSIGGISLYFTTERTEGNTVANWISLGFTLFIFVLLAISIIREIKYMQECKSFEIYKQMAYTDKLTECGNRAALDSEIKEGSKKHSSLTFILIDFNHLKLVNDKMGHIAGDKMIHDGAGCLKTAFAPQGKVFRLGGDEFAIVLWDEIGKIETYYKHLDEVLDDYNKTSEIHLSLAKGHFESPCLKASAFFDEIYSKADKNMYIDKERCHKLSDGQI